MDLTILSKKEAFLDLVMERLGKAPIDFCERAATIEKDKEVWRAAGVLLPLAFLTVLSSGTSAGEFFMVLIKRSSSVPQAGDLSCPGGMLDGYMDPLFRPIIAHGIIPALRERLSPMQSSGELTISEASPFFWPTR